jgi:hypothetical protein
VADDDVTATEETEEDDTSAGEEATGTETEWKPPTKDEWTRVQNALKKRNTENQKLREKSQAADTTTETEVAKALREQQEKADKRILVSEAKAALVANKAKPDRVAALLRVADTSELKLGDDGEIDGLDEWVDAQKAAYPEFFDGRTTRGNIGAGDKEKAPPKTLSYGQQLLKNAKQK